MAQRTNQTGAALIPINKRHAEVHSDPDFPRPASAIEAWAKLHAEDDAPGGASWSGTRLAKPDHDRIRSSAKHILLIPTDTTRAKLTAWDDANEEWVDMVYYGD